MKARVLDWLRLPWQDPLANPIDSYGPEFMGSYEPHAGRVLGHVRCRIRTSRYLPASVVIVCDGQQIGATEQFERDNDGWRFEIEPSSPFTAQDVVQDRIRTFAIDHLGQQHQLSVDGATQLRYVREISAPTELVIDFSKDGNSRQYLMEGWSGQEPGHVWTLGKASTIAVTFAMPGSRYGLETVASPFLVREKLPRQTVRIFIGSSPIAGFSLGADEPVRDCTIPGELTQEGRAVLRIEHPDAARPCDLTASQETREVALAFKRLTLRRYPETL